jgi:hypothetical protein
MVPARSFIRRVLEIAGVVSASHGTPAARQPSGGLDHDSALPIRVDLIPWDHHAQLVVDFLPDAFGPPAAGSDE